MTEPLAGRRILVTRSERQSAKLSDGITASGGVPVEVPVLEIVPPGSFEPLDEALKHLDRYDWLILTSANTISAICARAQQFAVKLEKAEGLKVAAIGRATAEAAKDFGFKVDVIPQAQVAEGLLAALGEAVRGKRILLPRAAIARDVLPDRLHEAGAVVDVVDAYRNVIPETAVNDLRSALSSRIDAATFTSSSSATHLAEVARAAGFDFPFDGVKAVSIGPITSATLQELGWAPAIEADPHDISGLIAAVTKVLHS
jgi:uroporphyrinogen-III synthase